MASCANCGKTFSPSRGDARYCSNRCRLITFREGTELATIVKHHLSFGTTLDGDTDERLRLRELMNAYPDAVRKLGEPLIRAALATTLPRHGCRWDLAYMYAIRFDQPKPRPSRAGRTLLGEPCPSCERRMRPKRQTQSTGGPGRSTTKPNQRDVAHHVNRSTSPASQPKVHDPLRTCTTCHAYRLTHPGTSLTAGGYPEGIPAHNWNEQPKPGQRWSM